MAGKVQFGISNAHYAVITTDEQGNMTWGTPVAMPGAENFNVDNGGGNDNIIYADNINYWSRSTSTGISGDLQMAKFPDQFKIDCLGHVRDETTGGLLDGPSAASKDFALGFQLETNVGGKRVWLFKCSGTNPNYTAATMTESITEANETSTITASPVEINGQQYVRLTCETGDAGYDTFFDAVPLVGGGDTPSA